MTAGKGFVGVGATTGGFTEVATTDVMAITGGAGLAGTVVVNGAVFGAAVGVVVPVVEAAAGCFFL